MLIDYMSSQKRIWVKIIPGCPFMPMYVFFTIEQKARSCAHGERKTEETHASLSLLDDGRDA